MNSPHDHVERTTDKEPAWGWWMIGVGLLVTLVLAGIAGVQFWFVQKYLPGTADGSVTKFGISGDFFGFANALFSALAFAMIIVTLWMQKYELKQQRIELDQTQEIMRLQKTELHDQNESLRRQTFENTFFSMLEMHGELVRAITSPQPGVTGRSAFAVFLGQFSWEGISVTSTARGVRSRVELTSERYEKWYEDNEDQLGHYFRTLYNMMRYVHENGGDQKALYARLVRAQLSSSELKLLFFNGLSRYGREKFKPLIEQYALLKHLRRDEDIEKLDLNYDLSAFGDPNERLG